MRRRRSTPRRWHRQAHELPRDNRSCGWLATLPPPPSARILKARVRADCTVIGAGFTGLAAARRLAELRPDWRIVVLEGQHVGEGASGRSSGFLVDLVDFVARMEPEARRRYVATARSGIAELRRLRDEHDIDCAWDDRGWLRGAAGSSGMQFLESYPPSLDELGLRYEWLDHRAMANVTGTRFYRAGLRLVGYPLIQPASLVRGLARSLPEGVELFEKSPVQRLARARSFRLETPQGSVEADRLILATNGYTPALGFLKREVFPLLTFGSLTRVLTPQEQARLGGDREWGVLAMDPMGSTIRRTRDQRILLRNTVHYARSLEPDAVLWPRIKALHRKALSARLPGLADLEIEHTWAGVMGTSWSHRHWFGELEPGLFASAGYTGAGIAMGTASGVHLAELAAGYRSEGLDALLGLPRPNRMPPEPFRSFGGRYLVTRMNAQAGPFL